MGIMYHDKFQAFVKGERWTAVNDSGGQIQTDKRCRGGGTQGQQMKESRDAGPVIWQLEWNRTVWSANATAGSRVGSQQSKYQKGQVRWSGDTQRTVGGEIAEA